MRILFAAAMLAATAGGVPAPAQQPPSQDMSAQEPWTHEGITFPKREGWCATKAVRVAPDNRIESYLDMHPCGAIDPVLHASIAERATKRMTPLEAVMMTSRYMDSDKGKQIFSAMFKGKDPTCEVLLYLVDHELDADPPSYTYAGNATCTKLGLVKMRIRATFVQIANGDMWSLDFEHPNTALTEADRAMIRNAVAAIARH